MSSKVQTEESSLLHHSYTRSSSASTAATSLYSDHKKAPVHAHRSHIQQKQQQRTQLPDNLSADSHQFLGGWDCGGDNRVKEYTSYIEGKYRREVVQSLPPVSSQSRKVIVNGVYEEVGILTVAML